MKMDTMTLPTAESVSPETFVFSKLPRSNRCSLLLPPVTRKETRLNQSKSCLKSFLAPLIGAVSFIPKPNQTMFNTLFVSPL